MSNAAPKRVFKYGVIRAPFLIDGLPALAAIDAHGNIRKVRKLRPGDDAEALGVRLWEWLRKHYPQQPRLELVRERPPAPSTKTVLHRGRVVDARLLEDARSPIAKALHRRRMVRAAADRACVLPLAEDRT